MTRWVTKDPITSLTGTESMPITQGGVDKQVSPDQLAAFIGGGGGGSGDVSGPASSVDSHVALFDGTTGKLLKDGGALASIATSGAVGDLSGFPGGTTDFLRADGSFAAPPGGGGGGLTNFTEGADSSAPNATIPYVYLLATNAAANVDLALPPKGDGAFSLSVADGTTAGGNKRGRKAVDLQMERSAAAQVASGDGSFAAGKRNTVSSSNGVVLGYNNSLSGGGFGACIGASNSVAAAYSVAFGAFNAIFADYGIAFGQSCTVGGVNSVAFGANCKALGTFSTARGRYAIDRTLTGMDSFSSGRFAAEGDAQRMSAILRRATTDATSAVLSSDGAAPSATNQFVLPNNSAFVFKATVVARENTTGDSASWEITFHVTRGANAASTAIVGTPAVNPIAASPGAAAWALAVTASTTRGAPDFTVTGEAGRSLKWVSDVYSCVQVVG